MARPDRYLNLVFQGGGVRGIAYAGALAAMPPYCKIHAVAGASAGAIVAALLAVGTTVPDLKTILESGELFGLLEAEERERYKRLEAAIQEARGLWPKLLAGHPFVSLSIWGFLRKHNKVWTDLSEVWSERGLHRTSLIRVWLDQKLQDKSFSDIEAIGAANDLKIVAADVSRREYVVYSKDRSGDTKIAEAVNASLSIPLFFWPYQNGPDYAVDGGMLSNFPSFLFAQGKYPTIGFRLRDLEPPKQIDTTFAYLKGLILTMTEAHDKVRGEPPYFKSYTIDSPSSIPATKFELSTADIRELYNCGFTTGVKVDWDTYSSPIPRVSFYDPNPHETLEYSLSQAYKLWQNYANPALWVDDYRLDVTMTVHIERDWSTRYNRSMAIEVFGNRSLFMTRSLISGFSPTLAVGRQSLAAIIASSVFEEIKGSGSEPLIRIPAFNDETQKGFVLFYLPPISEGQGIRRFHSSFRLPEEFAKTVAAGVRDTITYSMRQIAQKQNLKLKFEILADADLPMLTISPQFACKQSAAPDTKFDQETGRKYRLYECGPIETDVHANQSFQIFIEKA